MQRSILQQYAVNVRGGGPTYSYYMSVGLRQEPQQQHRKSRRKVQSQSEQYFRSGKKNLTIQGGVNYSTTKAHNNAVTMADLSGANQMGISPYIRSERRQAEILHPL